MRSVEDVLIARVPCSVLTLRRTPAAHLSVVPATKRRRRRSLVLECLSPRMVATGVDVSGKNNLLDFVSTRFAQALGDIDTEKVREALLEREREQSTGLGEGVAIPHGVIHGAKRIMLGAFVARKPIDYDAIDGERVDVFLPTVGPPMERDAHLRLLSEIARMCRDTDMLERLRTASDDDDILRAVRDAAREIQDGDMQAAE